MSIVSAVSSARDLLKSVVVPIKCQFGYVMSSKSYFRDLQKEVENLRDTVERVENSVVAGNDLRMVPSRVIEWLARAEQALEEAEYLLRDSEKASKTCCRGTLPDLNCRHQFSRKAKEKIEEIQRLAREYSEFRGISFRVGALTSSPRIAFGLRAVSGLLGWAVTAIKRQFEYVISFESYAQDLQEEVWKLAYEVDWVDLAEKEAKKDHRIVYSLVVKRHESADEALTEARNLLFYFKINASKAWCCGNLPDNCFRYEFSAEAEEKIERIQELTQEISKYKKLDEICTSARPGYITSTSMPVELRDDGVFESRASVIQEIMDALADNSNSVVGVDGMGGVGKSCLLLDVERRIRQERSFDWIAKAEVWENPDIKRIQGKIAHCLGLSDVKKDEDVSLRAKLLRERLEYEERKKKKVLIILDNLWGRLDLDKVGIPCGPDNKARGCKLLLTSRDRNVLQSEMGCDEAFRLGGLLPEEASALFERIVGDKVQKVEFGTLVNEALHRCAGVPFLIVAMAKRFKNAELFEWEDALKKMEKFVDKDVNESSDGIPELIPESKDKEIFMVYAANLRKEVGNLENEVERVGVLETEVRNNGRKVRDDFTRWKDNADKALKEARDLLGDLEGAIKTGGHGTLSDSSGRDQFSTNAEAQIKVVRDLAQQCSDRFKELNDISIPAWGNPAGIVQLPTVTVSAWTEPTDDGVFKSRASVIKEIMDALTDDTKSVVGVHGMGGVGKSTLLLDVEKRIRAERSFDWVAKSEVSANPDINRIQGEIADDLSLSDIKDKQSVTGRAKFLRERLKKDEGKKKKVLIILDNLWEKLDLDKVGIPCGLDNKAIGCKLLLTARDQHVLRREMRCDSAFLLGELEEEEAKRLFEKMVGGKVQVELEPLVEEALRICAGLPFLIVAISKLFIDTTPSDSEYALKQIWNEETGDKITNTLQLSYRRISEEAKSLLRLCVACGVSEPSLEYLARYCFGLGIFRGVGSVREVRDGLLRLIHNLQASSLLLDGDEGTDGFKIHDLVREFVASFASTDRPLLVLKDKDESVRELSEDKLKSCDAMCFPYVDLEELPEELVCPELRIFLLLQNYKTLEISDSYFNSMKNLMVLHLTEIRLTRSPSPFQSLEKLHSLCLDYCSLEDVAILGELKGIQILSLRNSDIQRLPKEIGQLTELRLLDLDDCSELHMIEPGLLGKLTKLEELYMRNSFDKWDAVELTPATNASLIELNNMKELRTLHVSIPDPSALPKDLNFEQLTKYKIQIGDVQRWWWSMYEGSRTLQLKLDPTCDILQKECIQNILCKTDDMYLDGLNKTEHSICRLSVEGFPKLKHLQVKDSPSVRHILERSSFPAFKALETLLLKNLIDLEKICYSDISSSKSFSTLKVVRVESCNEMEVLFPHSVVRELPQLEEIEVVDCKSMRGIVEADDDRGKLKLPKLRILELRDLPNIENFIITGSVPSGSTSDGQVGTQIAFFSGQQVTFPSLETLYISWMDSIEMIWDNRVAADSFPKLKSLRVDGCKILTSLFPASIFRDLTQLEELQIRECGIAEVIEKQGGVLFPRFDFPKLTSIQFEHLTELKCLYTGTHTSHWPALKTLRVDGCNKVEILASQIEDDIPRHKQSLFLIEKGVFPNLQEFKLDLCDRMEIWHGDFHDEEFFRKLRVLELRHLSKESAISTSRFIESLTNLEELVVCESYLEERSSDVKAMEGPSHEQKVILPFSRQTKLLKTLDVSHCDGLSSMFTPTIAENLVALTKLRISNCRILAEVLHDEEGEERREVAFSQLKCMELDGLIELRCFSTGGQALRFPLLEDVIVNGCPNMEVFSKGPIKAPKLEKVQVCLKKMFGQTEYQHYWNENLNVTIQNMFREMSSVAGDQFVRLFEFPELIEKWHNDLNPLNSSWQLKTLLVDKCPSFINAMPSKLMLVLEKMTSLQVGDCESLEEIFDLQGLEAVESTRVLPCLEDLKLTNLPKLRQLWNKDLQGTMFFNSLSSLTLYKCSNLKHVFSASMARCLANIGRMEIRECNQMEGVIEEEEGQGSSVEKITFSNLEMLELERLPNLTSFLSGKDHALDCPKIRYLTIAHCPKMRSLTWKSSMEIDHSTPSLFTPRVQFLELRQIVLSRVDNISKIWPDDPLETLTFDSLWSVEVQNCKSLENVFPHWLATRLTQLEKLQVESCRIEEIVANGDDISHSNIAQVLFPKLTTLVLHDMPRLKTLCPNLPTLSWPFLKELRVTHCDKVNMSSLTASINKWTQRNDQQDLLDQEAHSSLERDFPNLEKLLLVENDIQIIEDGKFPDDIFGQTKAITLACFHEEKAVFPTKFLLERFQNLKSLEVFCSSFDDIFPDEGLADEGKHLVLERLTELKLSKLHKLKRLWREDYLVSKVLQSIKTLDVWDCPSLTTLFPAVTSFHNLTKLVVKNSSGLVHLATASVVASLVNLTDMTIIGCEKMKEVVAKDENGEEKVTSFRSLHWLRLQNMPSLECFSSTTSCILRFPSLWRIEVEECPKMKIFSKGTLSTPELEYGTLFRYDWNEEWKGDMNRAIRELSA